MNKQELKEKYKDEQVFIVLTSEILDINDKFNFSTDQYLCDKLNHIGKFIYRYEAEQNNVFQQIIPYVIIYNPKLKKYYISKRTHQSGEQRLYDKYSIGFGGHINPCDFEENTIINGLYRELNEELQCTYIGQAKFIGTIRNITSELNDHLGLVYIQYVEEASIKETDKLIGEWLTADELFNNYSKFEDWGKFLINYLYENKNFLNLLK